MATVAAAAWGPAAKITKAVLPATCYAALCFAAFQSAKSVQKHLLLLISPSTFAWDVSAANPTNIANANGAAML
jgi:hypothetical protein